MDIEPEAEDDKNALKALTHNFFARPWHFITSVPRISDLPETDGIEVAFAGRSNVGKSSLLNALVNQKTLARTSNTPGRTQMLNFFTNGTPISLVDMPGYGYAKAPKDMVDAWTKLIKRYLSGRPNLARVYVLIDSRHGIKENDQNMLSMLDKAAVSYQVILTKSDKISAQSLESIVEQTGKILAKHVAAHPDILITSSEKYLGIEDVQASIVELGLQRGVVMDNAGF